MKRSALLCLFGVLCASPLTARIGPFPDQFALSPSGRTYVVARNDDVGRQITFELCQRRPGAPPMRAETLVARDSRDTLLAQVIATAPADIIVLDDPPSFILFDTYGSQGFGRVVTYIDARGEVVFETAMKDLFDEATVATFPLESICTGLGWCEGLWVDRTERRLLVLAAGDRLRMVSLKDGRVITPAADVLLQMAQLGSKAERCRALEVLHRRRLPGFVPLARRTAADLTQPLSVRLRAIVALGSLGEAAPFAAEFLRVVEAGTSTDERCYAVQQLLSVLAPERGLPVLRELMRGPASDVWHPAQLAFASAGENAVPTLTAMLLEEGESVDYRGGAAHALARIASPLALEALLEAIRTAPSYVASAAVPAAVATGAPDLGVRFATLYVRGSSQDGLVVGYFRDHPTPANREALEDALERRPLPWVREVLEGMAVRKP